MPANNARGRPPAPQSFPDPHCCHIPEGADPADTSKHCPQKGTIEIVGPDGPEDYTHACGDHAGEMRRPGDKAFRLRDGKEIKEQ